MTRHPCPWCLTTHTRETMCAKYLAKTVEAERKVAIVEARDAVIAAVAKQRAAFDRMMASISEDYIVREYEQSCHSTIEVHQALRALEGK